MDKKKNTILFRTFRDATRVALEKCDKSSFLVKLLERKTSPLSPEDWAYILDRMEVKKEFLLEKAHRASLIKDIMSLNGRYRENSLKARYTEELEEILASLEEKARKKAEAKSKKEAKKEAEEKAKKKAEEKAKLVVFFAAVEDHQKMIAAKAKKAAKLAAIAQECAKAANAAKAAKAARAAKNNNKIFEPVSEEEKARIEARIPKWVTKSRSMEEVYESLSSLEVRALGSIKESIGENISDVEAKRVLSSMLRDLENEVAEEIIDPIRFQNNGIMQKMTTARVLQLEFTANEDMTKYFITTSLTNFSDNRYSREMSSGRETNRLFVLSTGAVEAKKFAKDFININLSSRLKKKAISFLGSSIYIHYRRDKSVMVYKKASGSNPRAYYCFNYGKVVPLKDSEIKELLRYDFMSMTASGTRSLSCPFILNSSLEYKYDLLNKSACGALAVMHRNALKALADCKTNSDLLKLNADLLKRYGYIANVSTQSVSFGKVPGYCLYKGKFENVTNETELHKKSIKDFNKYVVDFICGNNASLKQRLYNKLEAETADGKIWINSRVLADMLNEHMKANGSAKRFTEADLIGLMLQCRPGAVKASADVVPESIFKQMLEGAKNMAAIRGIECSSYGEEDNCLFLTDLNGLKLEQEEKFNEEMSFEVLAQAKSSQGATSKQIIKNFLDAAEDAGKYQEAVDKIEESLKIQVSNEMEKVLPKGHLKDSIITKEDIVNNIYGYNKDIVNKASKNARKHLKHIFKTAAEQSIDSIIDIIDRMAIDFNIRSFRLSSDPSFILSGGKVGSVLRQGEFFVNDENVTDVVMFKYPIATSNEYYACRNVDITTIADRLNDLDLDQEVKDAIVGYYKCLRRPVMVLPGLMAHTYQCAGLDYDYDGSCCLVRVKEPENKLEENSNYFLDLLLNRVKKNGYFGVYINNEYKDPEDDSVAELPVLESKSDFLGYLERLKANSLAKDINKGVGEITNIIDTLDMLRYVDDKNLVCLMETLCEATRDESADHRRTINFCESNDGVDYKNIPLLEAVDEFGTVKKFAVVSQSIEKSIIENLENVSFTAANIRRVIKDLVYIGRMYQELTIDAAKKLYQILIVYYQTVVRAESTMHLSCGVNANVLFGDKKISEKDLGEAISLCRGALMYFDPEYICKLNRKVGDRISLVDKKTGEIVREIFQDPISEIQNKVLKDTFFKFIVDVNSKYQTIKISESALATLNKTLDFDNLKNVDVFDDIIKNVTKIYGQCYSSYFSTLDKLSQELRDKKIKRNEFLLKKKMYSDALNDKFESLSETARFILKDFSVIEAGKIMLAASMAKFDKESGAYIMDPEHMNGAYLRIAPEFGLTFVLREFGSGVYHQELKDLDRFEKSLLYDGQSVEILLGEIHTADGVGLDVYVDEGIEDGNYLISIENDRYYLTADIASLMEDIRKTPDEEILRLRVVPGRIFDPNEFINKGYYSLVKDKIHNDSVKDSINSDFAEVGSFTIKKFHMLGKLEWNNVVVANNVKINGKNYKEVPFCTFDYKSDSIRDFLDGVTIPGEDFMFNIGNSGNCYITMNMKNASRGPKSTSTIVDDRDQSQPVMENDEISKWLEEAKGLFD